MFEVFYVVVGSCPPRLNITVVYSCNIILRAQMMKALKTLVWQHKHQSLECLVAIRRLGGNSQCP